MNSIATRENKSNSMTVRDVGGAWIILLLVGGVPFIGFIVDYIWNYLVMSFGLGRMDVDASRKRKHLFCFIVTVVGVVIDWIYFEITWGQLEIENFGGMGLDYLGISPFFPAPGEHPALEIITILMPMAVLFLEYFLLSKLIFRTNSKQGLVLGGIMSFLTSPWLIVAAVLLHW